MDRDGSPPQTLVVLRPLGSPVALGLAGLAIASFVSAGFDLHWIAAGVHFVLSAITQLGDGTGWAKAGAVVGLVVAGVSAYTAWASEVEDMADRAVLPTGRLDGGRAALRAPFAEHVRGVEHEAGVRRQL